MITRRAYLLLTVVLTLLSVSLLSFQAGEILPQPPITPTLTKEFVRTNVFPAGLVCAEAEIGPGPTWHGITIGRTSVDDLIRLFEDYDSFSIDQNEQEFEFREGNSLYQGRYCTQNDIVSVLHIWEPYRLHWFLPDFVAEYGAPDVVTYTLEPVDRLLFWFDQGIAVVVYINQKASDYGVIGSTIYFPYQSPEGYETRWPFNRTWPEPIPYYDLTNVPGVQNPFDFDAMLATITAQPSRTPTPTFTPRPTRTMTPP